MNSENLKLLQQLALLGTVTFTDNGNKYLISENDSTEFKSQLEVILAAIKKMDIDIINSNLDSNRTYQGFEKSIFIKKLQAAFEEFRDSGDTFLNLHKGFCNSKSCSFNCKGFSFVGNNSNNYFDLIFDIVQGEIFDIYQCKSFECLKTEVSRNSEIIIEKPS